VVLKGRFEITPNTLADPIGSPRALAHAARDRINGDRGIFALVCDPDLPPNTLALDRLKDHSSKSILRLIESGVVPWPESGDHRLVLIFERPPGPRLLPSRGVEFEPMKELEIINRVMAPVTTAMDQLDAMDMTHGAIRPTNIFMTRVKTSLAVLGENASAPLNFHQPVAFLPIELAQAQPAGRGGGTIADDVYALAVTVLTLLLGRDPAIGRDDTALLAEKMEHTSYIALAGHHRLPSVLREPLRGMLDDRPELRWSLNDLKAWLSDRRLKVPQHVQGERAQRAFILNGKPFYQSRALAHQIAVEWNKVKLEDKGHEILTWTRRSLGDDNLGDMVLGVMEQSDRDDSTADGMINLAFAARMSMALDYRGAIRYGGVSAHMDGIGPMLAVHYKDGEVLRSLAEMMLEDLPAFRQRTPGEDSDLEKPVLNRYLRQMARHLKNPRIGFGIERVLYSLNPLQYCRSPLVIDQKIMRVEDLLPALEKISGRSHQGPPIDRHIAAFVASHLRIELESMLAMASDEKNPENVMLGILGVMGALQGQAGGGAAYPGVARWVGRYLKSVVESFHHRMWREKVANEIPALVKRGDLAALYSYLANGEIRSRDRNGFAQAVAEFDRMTAEISYLKSFGLNDPKRTEEYGRQISAGFTGLLAFAAVISSCFFVW
jgi:serine/threonine protein kinase